MPRILVTQSFPFAVDGLHVIQIEIGAQEVSERCAEVAVEHLGFATHAEPLEELPKSETAEPPVEVLLPEKVAAPVVVPPKLKPVPAARPKAPQRVAKPRAAAKAKPAGEQA